MKDAIIFFLSLLIIVAFTAVSFCVLEGQIKTDNPNVLLLVGNVAGAWQTTVGVVVAYWFGTTKSSSEKDKTISSIITPQQTGETK